MMDVSNRVLRAALLVLIVLGCVYLLAQLGEFLHDIWKILRVLFIPFLAALVLSYLLQPIVDKLAERRVPRGVAILLIYASFALIAAILILKCIPIVAGQLTQLGEHLPGLVTQADHWLDQLADSKRYLPDAIRRGVESALTQVERSVSLYAARTVSVLTNTVGALFVAFVVPFLVFYMLKDGKAIGRATVQLFPVSYRDEVREILAGIDATLGSYVRGQLLVMLAVGVLAWAGYLVIGMPYALLLALFLGLMDIIPYLGPFLGAAPAVLLALSISPAMVVKVVVVNVVVQQCEGNLIQPAIIGRTLNLHPMAIVAAVLIGGEIGGVLGLVCAVPVLAVLKVIWTNIRAFRERGA